MTISQSDIIDTSAESLKQYDGVNFTSFDSLAEAIEFGNKGKLNPDFSRDSHSTNESFTGTPNWPYMEKVAENGWTKGRALVAASLETIFQTGAAQLAAGEAIEYDIAGHYPDAALAASGETFAMVNAGDLAADKPIIKLVVNLAASCHVNKKFLANRGAAIAALVDQIESAGNSCEIHAVSPSTNDSKKEKNYLQCECIVLKRAGERLGIDEIAFGLGHPSMLRRVCLAIMENDPWLYNKGFNLGYGLPRDLQADALPADAIYIRRLDNSHSYSTPELAMETIQKTYRQQAEAKGFVEVAQ